MRIILATPLYPPDVAWPAPYTKELAQRLAPTHSVTVVTYGEMPEKVEGVRIIAVSKRVSLPFRLASYTRALWQAARSADLIYAENGASVELPLAVVSFLLRTPIVMHMGDERAHARAALSATFKRVEQAALSSAQKVITDSPAPRPEILPFSSYPKAAFEEYEQSWQRHLAGLEDIFTHAKR